MDLKTMGTMAEQEQTIVWPKEVIVGVNEKLGDVKAGSQKHQKTHKAFGSGRDVVGA